MPRTLIVIDLQQGLVDTDDPDWGPRSTPDLTTNVSQILTLWRHHNWPIIHIHHDDPDPAHPLRSDRPKTARPHACAAPAAGEVVLRKSSGSAFVSTPLAEELRGGKEICLIGMAADQCINDNTRHAKDLGYEIWVVADACATYGFPDYKDAKKMVSAEEVHRLSMGMLANGYARVLLTEQLLKILGEEEGVSNGAT